MDRDNNDVNRDDNNRDDNRNSNDDHGDNFTWWLYLNYTISQLERLQTKE